MKYCENVSVEVFWAHNYVYSNTCSARAFWYSDTLAAFSRSYASW